MMGAFATDQTVGERDLRNLKAAVRGERKALRDICERYKTAVLATALQSGHDWEPAYECVPQVLRSLCGQLLGGRFACDQWANQLVSCVADYFRMTGENADSTGMTNQPVLSGLESIPKIARRRVVTAALPKLPLPELTAILLQHLDHQRPIAMVGLVADSEEEVCQRLAAAYEILREAVRTQQSTS